MHVVIGATHRLVLGVTPTFTLMPTTHYSLLPRIAARFARTVVDSVVMDNVNPIARLERSMLTVACTIHQTPDPATLLRPSRVHEVHEHSPDLFPKGLCQDKQICDGAVQE